MPPSAVFSILVAYVAGSVPFGLLVARAVRGVDLRRHGSGNIGATNVFRVVGKKWGLLVLLLDAVKGYGAVWAVRAVFDVTDIRTVLLAGVAAILGHSFSVWLGFKGGKGVATSLGVFLALAPLPTAAAFVFWAVVFAAGRIIAVASLCAAAVFPALIFWFDRDHPDFLWLLSVSLLLAGLIAYTHRSNIRRIFRGEEKKLI
jgi:glycerol-3-phosphate acyltransferase PlsY